MSSERASLPLYLAGFALLCVILPSPLLQPSRQVVESLIISDPTTTSVYAAYDAQLIQVTRL
jgi:hypothetical protein